MQERADHAERAAAAAMADLKVERQGSDAARSRAAEAEAAIAQWQAAYQSLEAQLATAQVDSTSSLG